MSSVFNYRCRLPADQVRKGKKEKKAEYRIQETGYKIQDTGYRTQNTGEK